jgi:iron complex transport system substrate-binding protein
MRFYCGKTKESCTAKEEIHYLICFCMMLVLSCTGQKHEKPAESGNLRGSEVNYAERFSLQVTDSCTIVTINNPWQGANGISQRYYLVKKETGTSIHADPSRIIYVPVKKIICMSTTHLAMISALNEIGSVSAVSGKGYVYNPEISERISAGIVKDVGYETGLNSELILKTDPDLVMMYGIGSESAGYTGKIEELGVKVMFNADYLENHPLGKAEWIKLFGALYCKEKIADSIFLSVSGSYNSIKDEVSRRTEKRTEVLLGLPYKDTWYISPGNSYISRLIKDAGGDYLWEETESPVSMPLGIEDVFIKSLKADFWLNIGNVTSKTEIASLDSRLCMLPCFINGNLYNNNRRINSTGGNDYWESGTVYPDILLKDIATILHPDLFPEHELLYYKKIK